MAHYNNFQRILKFFIGIFVISGLFCLIVPSYVVAQHQVSGQVTDAQTDGSLPGVNIAVKGTTIGTSSDKDGNYSLSVSSSNDTLIYSFIGYKTQIIPIKGRAKLNVEMQSQTIEGEEMVVVGYGQQKKSDLTGSVSSIGSEDFNSGVNASVAQLMQGRSAGVQISQTNGAPGGGVSVNIRGAGSINAGNQPLYVVDGTPFNNSPLQSSSGAGIGGAAPNSRNPLNSLNSDDIETISVLKGASATAIYGSRGANGVVLITTKGGREGGIKINYSGQVGVQSVARRLDILTARQYIDVINGISKDQGKDLVFSDSEINAIGSGTNWQNQIYRKAPMTNNTFSVSGGDKNTSFRTSLNYFNQEGVVKNSGIKKYIARINIENDFFKNGDMGIHLNHSIIKNYNNPDGESFEEGSGPISAATFYDPTVPVYSDDGSIANSPNINTNNPVALIKGYSNQSNLSRTFGNVYFKYNFMKTLDAKASFGYNHYQDQQEAYNSRITIQGGSQSGIANVSTLEVVDLNLKYTMHYNKQLNKNNSIKILGGMTYEKFDRHSNNGSINGFPSDHTGVNNLGLGDTNNDNLNSNKEVHKLISYLGRVNYDLLNKYLFTATFRADGSSRFGGNNRFAYFPSGAVAWKLTEENFIPSSFDQLKLRASYGISGNQAIGNYQYLSTYAPSGGAVFDNETNSGISPTRIANPNLKWESTEQFDVGLDASILNGRLSGSFDYYIRSTKNMLINKPLPRSSGYFSKLVNIGKMNNRGIDIQINSTNIQTHDFNWSTTVNFSKLKNTIKSIGELNDIITGFIKVTQNSSIITPGESLFSYYGYKVSGIFQQGDNISNSAQPNAQPGFPIFQDTNDDGKITAADKVVLGDPSPNFTFGISNTLSYQNFKLSFFISGKQGVDLLNATLLESLYPKNFRRNRIAEYALNRWTPDNTNTKWPSGVAPTSYGGGGSKVNSLDIEDASYIQLRNVKLSYNIPQSIIQSANIYVTGQNLATITNYSGVNPDANVLGRSNAHIDFNSYPLARTILFGVNLHF